jgi:hypothetical protein
MEPGGFSILNFIYNAVTPRDSARNPFCSVSASRRRVIGDPDHKFISTSYVERQNLNMRMNMRRFTCLTNAFSKKLENYVAMIALFHMHHNFARIHQTLRVTPAMEAGLSSHVWSIQEIVSLSSSEGIVIKAA